MFSKRLLTFFPDSSAISTPFWRRWGCCGDFRSLFHSSFIQYETGRNNTT